MTFHFHIRKRGRYVNYRSVKRNNKDRHLPHSAVRARPHSIIALRLRWSDGSLHCSRPVLTTTTDVATASIVLVQSLTWLLDTTILTHQPSIYNLFIQYIPSQSD